jgi:hypothetical protein
LSEKWTIVSSDSAVQSENELKRVFGEEAIISRVGSFNLVHLDHPSPEEVAKRIAEFDPNDLFEDDCPLCQMLRDQGGNVVYSGLET